MSSMSGPAHRSVSNIRPQPTINQAPPSPHTPLRTISSTYASPSALRAEEETVIIELGSRYLRTGFAGDAVPKAVVDFGPEEQRRAGDYRKWQTGYERNWRMRIQGKNCGEAYELWKMDLREVDLGLVGDKIERAVREAFTKHLLTDSRPRRMALVLPSQLPLPLLSITLDCLFTNFQPPSISLMSAPILATVAAGLRAALVVDIGWAETIVTSIYEYREIETARSVRASKLFGEEMFKMLAQFVDPTAFEEDSTAFTREAREIMSFEECEEVIARVAWCKPGKKIDSEPTHGLAPVQEEDEFRSSMRSLNLNASADATISIPLGSTFPPRTIQVPFSKLAEPCEAALFAAGRLPQDLDDEELPLHLLVYRSLLQLPIDIRSLCMSRIIFVGGGSNILGLKQRVLDDVNTLVERRGWDPVQGRAVEQLRGNPKLQHSRNRQAGTSPIEIGEELERSSKPKKANAASAAQEYDPIEEDLRRNAVKGSKPVAHGYLRAVDSLGAWSGASLISQSKIPAISVVDREQWLQHGASGASRSSEISMASQRQSMGPGLKSAAGDRSSWTLGLWG